VSRRTHRRSGGRTSPTPGPDDDSRQGNRRARGRARRRTRAPPRDRAATHDQAPNCTRSATRSRPSAEANPVQRIPLWVRAASLAPPLWSSFHASPAKPARPTGCGDARDSPSRSAPNRWARSKVRFGRHHDRPDSLIVAAANRRQTLLHVPVETIAAISPEDKRVTLSVPRTRDFGGSQARWRMGPATGAKATDTTGPESAWIVRTVERRASAPAPQLFVALTHSADPAPGLVARSTQLMHRRRAKLLARRNRVDRPAQKRRLAGERDWGGAATYSGKTRSTITPVSSVTSVPAANPARNTNGHIRPSFGGGSCLD
jgi:hypothetical protein